MKNSLFNSCLVLLALLTGEREVFSQRLERLPLPEVQPMPKLELNTTNVICRAGLLFISGACEGVAETLKFRYDNFQRVHPGALPERWNPEISWKRKYRNGDPEQGPAFFGSTTFLVWTTDRYHLFRTASRMSGAAGLTLPLWSGGKKKIGHYAAELAGSYVLYVSGFHCTHSIIYR